MKMLTEQDHERFQNGAREYAAYLETPERRLRSDLTFANLEDFLPPVRSESPLCALDLGSGTGVAAIPLARLGVRVTMLDCSLATREIAKRAALDAGVSDQIAVKLANVHELQNLFNAGSFDLMFCPAIKSRKEPEF
jgi:2-polyprenyl-3-methyl-5-hydroxy-6-metoxy-1,4-benzoquinol methylase